MRATRRKRLWSSIRRLARVGAGVGVPLAPMEGPRGGREGVAPPGTGLAIEAAGLRVEDDAPMTRRTSPLSEPGALSQKRGSWCRVEVGVGVDDETGGFTPTTPMPVALCSGESREIIGHSQPRNTRCGPAPSVSHTALLSP
jgi:hypothetical protein